MSTPTETHTVRDPGGATYQRRLERTFAQGEWEHAIGRRLPPHATDHRLGTYFRRTGAEYWDVYCGSIGVRESLVRNHAAEVAGGNGTALSAVVEAEASKLSVSWAKAEKAARIAKERETARLRAVQAAKDEFLSARVRLRKVAEVFVSSATGRFSVGPGWQTSCGLWAIHKTEDGSAYRVSHLPTGLALGLLDAPYLGWARAIVAHLLGLPLDPGSGVEETCRVVRDEALRIRDLLGLVR